jgi:hypothetical protein
MYIYVYIYVCTHTYERMPSCMLRQDAQDVDLLFCDALRSAKILADNEDDFLQ